MALDGITIFALTHELSKSLCECKIEKVNQPNRDEIVLNLRKKGVNNKLLINIGSNNPRVHFLSQTRENPKVPSMFCMLLRKHLAGSIIKNVTNINFERLIKIELLSYDEMGFPTNKYMYIELLGKFSNFILTDNDDMIIDVLKRVGFEDSTRPLLPNIYYKLPPKQEKISILNIENVAQINDKKDIVNSFVGMSDFLAENLFDENKEFMLENLKSFAQYVEKCEFKYYLIKNNDKIIDFSIIESKKYENIEFNNLSQLLENFYEQKAKTNALNSQHKELLKLVKNLVNRQKRKLIIQQKELEDTKKRDEFKIFGDLIVANLYALDNIKEDKVELINYFDENLCKVVIPLDITLSKKQNADKYFLKYNKLKNAEKILIKEIKKGEIALEYLESVLESIERTENLAELLEIKEELILEKVIKTTNKKPQKIKETLPHKYISTSGYTIYAGKNNRQNDMLTFKISSKDDIWFHTQKIHGTHVLLKLNGGQLTQELILECANIAAYHSKAKNSSNVAVDYTSVKNVKKPKGAKSGMVIFDNHKTVYVTPDEIKVKSMRGNIDGI